MSRPVSREEIKEVLVSLNGDKAPRPNGYNALFFKKPWLVIGCDVLGAIKDFLIMVGCSKSYSTAIALVPKVPNPIKVSYYRPTSCCSTMYKHIAKLIANRIKGSLPEVVSLE